VPRKNAKRLVEIGVVGRPHGIRGEVRVFLHNPQSQLLAERERVLLGDEADQDSYRIRSARDTGRHVLLAIEGVSDRDRAGRLKGLRLFVPRDELPELADDEVYVDDLIGLDVFCDGSPIGRVRASREQGGIEVLTVVTGDEELDLPLVEQYLVATDLDEGRIEVRDIDGLPRSPRQGR
jgi:16S rRNA processing protein RimM